VAIQIEILPLSAEAAKKQKKVWIASRHASLAVAMTGTGTAFFNGLLKLPARIESPETLCLFVLSHFPRSTGIHLIRKRSRGGRGDPPFSIAA